MLDEYKTKLRRPSTVFNNDAPKWLKNRNEKLTFAFEHVKDWGCAIDCGAWAGWWTNMLADRFEEVWAFEPIAVNAAFCRINNPMNHVHIIEAAISNRIGSLVMEVSGANYGKVTKQAINTITVPCTTIDTLGLSPGFIKLDLEGLDYDGLLGAVQTINRSSPVICVETKDYKTQDIHNFLTKHGYTLGLDSRPDQVWIKC